MRFIRMFSVVYHGTLYYEYRVIYETKVKKQVCRIDKKNGSTYQAV